MQMNTTQNTTQNTITRHRSRHRASASTALLATCLALGGLIGQPTATAHASGSPLRYVRGYSVQHGWLCYGWRSGALHCTRWWTRHNGLLISGNRAWVPSQFVVSVQRVVTRAATKVATKVATARRVRVRNTYPYGQCTYGAQALAPYEDLSGLGYARDWYARAQARGLPTGSTPRVGATVTFQPGVQGASWEGHVGHVVAIGSGGAFLMEAMNDSAGWGVYAYRWVHTGWGVGFIY